MEHDTHRRDYIKLALAHLCAAIAEVLATGLTAALPHLLIGGVYLHVAIRRHPASRSSAGPDA